MLEIMFDITRNIVVLLIVFSLLEMFLPRGEFRPLWNTGCSATASGPGK